MKVKSIVAALGVALAAHGTSALAFAPVWPGDGDSSVNTVIWHAGASASQSGLEIAVIESFCDKTKPVDLLNGPSNGKNYWALACIIKSGLDSTKYPTLSTKAGTKLLYNKRSQDGSGGGVAPLASQTAIGFMLPSTGAGTHCTDSLTTTNLNGTNVEVWNCTMPAAPTFAGPKVVNATDPTVQAVLEIPNIGQSDVEPQKFLATSNLPTGDWNLTGSAVVWPTAFDPSLLNASPTADQIFGISVNMLMYQDLQRMQFRPGPGGGATGANPLWSKCNPDAGGTYATDGDSEQCMPSLSAQEIRSMFMTGTQLAVSNFQYEQHYGQKDYATWTATGVSDQNIEKCRRENGSGTQAQFNAIFLGYPCTDKGAVTPQTPGFGSGAFVVQNNSGGTLLQCMDDYNGGFNNSGNNASHKIRWAVALIGTDGSNGKKLSIGGTSGTSPVQARFVKVDGFAPTAENVHAGDYYDWASNTLNIFNTTSGVVRDAYNALLSTYQAASSLQALNTNTLDQYDFGQAGWLAAPGGAANNIPDAVLVSTNPTNWYTRQDSNGNFNTCALPTVQKSSQYASGTAPTAKITVGPQNCQDANSGAGCY